MKTRHTAVWVGLTAATLLATSACGTNSARTAAKAVDGADRIMAALQLATKRTENLGSAEVRVSTDMGSGKPPITMEGTYSWGDGFAFDAEMDTKQAQMQTLTSSPKVRVLFVGGAYYYRVGPQPSGPLKGKEWMKIDGSAVFGEKGAQAMATGGGASPVDSMKYLRYADHATDLGEQTVDGQRTSHYRAVIKASQMGKFKDALSDKKGAFGSLAGPDGSMTVDIWLNGKDLPVRLKEDVGIGTVTMDFEKFGRTAAVAAPPAAQTGDLTELVKNARARKQ
ncbi:hypothetical protein [Streptomyces sp. NPDC046805]|uniref:hypothetical protein n=1 Tax=Streptomyces sp. NPDC046805 TaxID=3155134 RepID=UPI00340FEF0A